MDKRHEYGFGMAPKQRYLAIVEITERALLEGRAAEMELLFAEFDPFVTATPRGRMAVRLHITARSLPRAAKKALRAVERISESDAVALAVVPQADIEERAAPRSGPRWGPGVTWLDDLWIETHL